MKKQYLKRRLAMMLSFVMILSSGFTGVFATEKKEVPLEASTYTSPVKQVSTFDELKTGLTTTSSVVIQLANDIEMENNTLTISKGEVTLDLNGKTLSSNLNTYTYALTINKGASLTIKDTSSTFNKNSSSKGTFSITGENMGLIRNDGTFMLESGTLVSEASYATLQNYNLATVTGGTILSRREGGAAISNYEGRLNINGGSVLALNETGNTSISNNTGIVNISGGLVYSKKSSAISSNVHAAPTPPCELNITGGIVQTDSGKIAIYSRGTGVKIEGNCIIWGDHKHTTVINGSDNSKITDSGWKIHGDAALPNSITIPEGKTLTIPEGVTLTIPEGATLTNNGTLKNSGTLTSTDTIKNNGTINNAGGGIVNGTIDNSGGGIVTDKTDTYDITYTLTNLSATNQPLTIESNKALVATLTAQTGYTLPQTLDVTMGVTTLTSGTGYTYNSSTGVITIPAVTGHMVISAVGVPVGKILYGIEITTPPRKTTYTSGQTFNPAGMVVTATYGDGTTSPVVGYSFTPSAALSTSDKVVEIRYTEGGITRSVTQKIVVSSSDSSDNSNNDDSNDSSSNNSSSSSSHTGSNIVVIPPAADKPSDPTQVEIILDAKTDSNGDAALSISNKNVSDAIVKAQTEAKKNGDEKNGTVVVLDVNTGNKEAKTITINLPQSVLEKTISENILNTVIVVNQPHVKVNMDLNAITQINKSAQGDVALNATQLDNAKLSAEAKTAIGNRPVFDFSMTYGNNKTIDSFGTGNVSVSLPYKLQKDEKAENIHALYIDEKGKLQWIDDSHYDSQSKSVVFNTNHFSTYGVGYKEDTTLIETPNRTETPQVVALTNFTDITNHWAKEDIAFVVEEGILTGISSTTFGPNLPMTKGMFVTTLGRMAKIDASHYTNGKFADVKPTSYYAPYVNWAAEKGIVSGLNATTFAPDAPITRQEMALIMQNYANTFGYTLPKTNSAILFEDQASISNWAASAVQSMQMAGIISGTNGNKFNPLGTASRAEVSSVLHRYVKLVIEPATLSK